MCNIKEGTPFKGNSSKNRFQSAVLAFLWSWAKGFKESLLYANCSYHSYQGLFDYDIKVELMDNMEVHTVVYYGE